jgi:uncharacterized membrane-anchored protein
MFGDVIGCMGSIYKERRTPMKKIIGIIEGMGSIIGFIILLGPNAWQEANRSITTGIVVVLILAGIAGLSLLVLLAYNQARPTYYEKTRNRSQTG